MVNSNSYFIVASQHKSAAAKDASFIVAFLCLLLIAYCCLLLCICALGTVMLKVFQFHVLSVTLAMSATKVLTSVHQQMARQVDHVQRERSVLLAPMNTSHVMPVPTVRVPALSTTRTVNSAIQAIIVVKKS